MNTNSVSFPPINDNFIDPRTNKISVTWAMWFKSFSDFANESDSLIFQSLTQVVNQSSNPTSFSTVPIVSEDFLTLHWMEV